MTVCRRVSDWIEDLVLVDGQRDIGAECWVPLLTSYVEKLGSFVLRKARWTSPWHRIELDFCIAYYGRTRDFQFDGLPALWMKIHRCFSNADWCDATNWFIKYVYLLNIVSVKWHLIMAMCQNISSTLSRYNLLNIWICNLYSLIVNVILISLLLFFLHNILLCL